METPVIKRREALLSVSQAKAIAENAGVSLSIPTIRSIFKRSDSVVRIGNKFFLPRSVFCTILEKGEA